MINVAKALIGQCINPNCRGGDTRYCYNNGKFSMKCGICGKQISYFNTNSEAMSCWISTVREYQKMDVFGVKHET